MTSDNTHSHPSSEPNDTINTHHFEPQNPTGIIGSEPDLLLGQDKSRPEAIFFVPENLSRLDWEDAIGHSLDRIKGTVMTTAHIMECENDIPKIPIRDCLLGLCAQIEIMEKLVKFKPLQE